MFGAIFSPDSVQLSFPPGTMQLSFGVSKIFQIIGPLFAFIFFQEIPALRNLPKQIITAIKPEADLGKYDYLTSLILGFLSWKVGCDFGFLIVSTGAAPWPIAFTFAGLIPYTILQYLVYYLVGHKIVIQGQVNPFKEEFVVRPLSERRPLWKQFFSKFFHEDMNATSANVPMRRVALKPFVDYGGLVITWSFYNVGLLFFQSGEFNLDPVAYFDFVPKLVFYTGSVFGYIPGYNLGEFLYFRLLYLGERIKKVYRSKITNSNVESQLGSGWTQYAANYITYLYFVVKLRIYPFLNRYGINFRWLLSCGMGVVTVMLLIPLISSPIFSLSNQLERASFYSQGQLDQIHVQQFLSASHDVSLPDSDTLTQRFPEYWDATYFPISSHASEQLAHHPGWEWGSDLE